jgi:hypothetical protein
MYKLNETHHFTFNFNHTIVYGSSKRIRRNKSNLFEKRVFRFLAIDGNLIVGRDGLIAFPPECAMDRQRLLQYLDI